MSFPFRPKTDTIQSDLWQRPFRGPVARVFSFARADAAAGRPTPQRTGKSSSGSPRRVPAFDRRYGWVKCHSSPDMVNFFSR